MSHLVAIVGPTGIGKSKLALRLAQGFKGEIVSADSRQVYCRMDIGTAKPSPQELALVPHHLIDIVNPDEDFSLARYRELASRAIDDIQQRNKLPLLVGGSGLYVWSVLEGWRVPQVPPDLAFRQRLEKEVVNQGKDEIYQELLKVDPVAAQRIDPSNVRRVIRALEVYQKTGEPFSQFQNKEGAATYDTLIVGLTTNRQELYRRIDLRVDGMIKQGLVDEVRKLLDMDYALNLPAMSGIGYKQICLFLKGELTLPVAVQQMKFETHRFVRHQYSWFRLKDDRIKWFDIQGRPESDITASVAEFLGDFEAQL